MSARRLLKLMGSLPALALVASSCRSATEVVLKIDTDMPCTDSSGWRGVAVYVGKPGAALDDKWPALVTTQCDSAGSVGSLVVAPSGDKDELIGVRVVAGLTRNPEDCEAANYAGCIVARRALRYAPHESLELEVALLRDCVSTPCDADHTCIAGHCVDSDFAEIPTTPPLSADAPSVRCGDYGVRCATTGDVCCLTVDVSQGKAQGQCMPSEHCPSESVVLLCDDDSDCRTASVDSPNGPASCNLAYTSEQGDNTYWLPTRVWGSQCLSGSRLISPGLWLCQRRMTCGQLACIGSDGVGGQNQLPGYFWCEYGKP